MHYLNSKISINLEINKQIIDIMEQTIYSSPKGTHSGANIWISINSNNGITIEGYYWDKSPYLKHSDGDLELFLSIDNEDLTLLQTKVEVNSVNELIHFIINHFSQYETGSLQKIKEWLDSEGVKYSFFTY